MVFAVNVNDGNLLAVLRLQNRIALYEAFFYIKL